MPCKNVAYTSKSCHVKICHHIYFKHEINRRRISRKKIRGKEGNNCFGFKIDETETGITHKQPLSINTTLYNRQNKNPWITRPTITKDTTEEDWITLIRKRNRLYRIELSCKSHEKNNYYANLLSKNLMSLQKCRIFIDQLTHTSWQSQDSFVKLHCYQLCFSEECFCYK